MTTRGETPESVPALGARLITEVRADLWHSCALWKYPPGLPRLGVAVVRVAATPRIRAVVLLRLAQHAFRHRAVRPASILLCNHVLRSCGAEVHPGATIAPGLNLAHSSGIVIGRTAIIGPDAVLFQGVTIGDSGTSGGQPVIGARVRVGAGAKLLGPIVVGDDAVIGANAVVLCNVPAGHRAVGVPAKVSQLLHAKSA